MSVRTLMKESQNSISPNHLIPRQLTEMTWYQHRPIASELLTKTMKIVTHAAPLIEVFQYRMTSEPATIWFGLMMRYLQR